MSNNPSIYGLNDGTKPIKYSENDWFYMQTGTGSTCNPLNAENRPDCNTNRDYVQKLVSSTDILGAAITQYNDSIILYNRELLFTINILAGLALIIYYIYANSDALPKVGNITSKFGVIRSSMTSAASSAANKIPQLQSPFKK